MAPSERSPDELESSQDTRDMRTISLIILHCSATPEGINYSVTDIDRWHRDRGFKSCGYHYVVRLDGTIERGRPEAAIGAHCLNHNTHSIGVCYIGGLDAEGRHTKDTRTEAQKSALRNLLTDLRRRHPKAIIVGHNLFACKACPCFDAVREYQDL